MAEEAVIAAYAATGLAAPKVLFFDSPYAALSQLLGQQPEQLGRLVRGVFRYGLEANIAHVGEDKIETWSSLYKQLWNNLVQGLLDDVQQVTNLVERQTKNQLWERMGIFHYARFNSRFILTEEWACHSSYIDFCVSVLDCHCNQSEWSVFQAVIRNCGWLFPFGKICFVCNRPLKISFDHQNRLHAQGEPAILFADGFSVHAYHGALSEPAK